MDFDLVKKLKDIYCFFNFEFAIYNKEPDQDPEDPLIKYDGWYYIQVSESNDSAFYINEFKDELKKKDITRNFNYCDSAETVFFFKDLEIETLNRAFNNVLLLRYANHELEQEEVKAAKKYYEEQKLWQRIQESK